jgi:outer membrane protein insertion porin family
VSYLFPINEYSSFSFGLSFEQIDLTSTDFTPLEIKDFIDANPSSDIFKITTGLAYDTRDSLLYPTRGVSAGISVEASIPGSELEYYKANLRASWYIPLFRTYTFKISGDLGYGDGYGDLEELPFFKNYFAGGTSSVRGYETRSLGPRDTSFSPDPLGGDRRILLNASLLIPVPGSTAKDKRIALFIDGGQVYGPGQSLDTGEIRFSAGIGFNWLSPLGPLAISYAKPLNDKPGDETEAIQFTVGRVFE